MACQVWRQCLLSDTVINGGIAALLSEKNWIVIKMNARKARRLLGLALSLIGWSLLTLCLYFEFMFFYVQERILFVFPDIAEKVTIEELINNPDKFDGRWVRLEGEFWRRKPFEAVLVPPGSGSETIIEEGASDGDAGGIKNTENGGALKNKIVSPIPDYHLYLHNFSPLGLRTVSVLGPGLDQTSEIVGEYEKRILKYDQPHIDLVAIVNPRQKEFYLPVVLMLGLFVLTLPVFIVLFYFGRKMRTSAENVSAP